jgi:copper chaperone CopZ
METMTLNIPRISCGHCVRSIKNELAELDGIVTVEGSAENKTVTVTWNPPATLEKIRSILAEINYPVT